MGLFFLRQALNLVPKSRFFEAVLEFVLVALAFFESCNIFFNCKGHRICILKEDGDFILIGIQANVVNCFSVNKDFSLGLVVETTEQFYDCCFTGAVVSNQGNFFTGFDCKVQIPDCIFFFIRVGKAHIFKDDFWGGSIARGGPFDRRLSFFIRQIHKIMIIIKLVAGLAQIIKALRKRINPVCKTVDKSKIKRKGCNIHLAVEYPLYQN